MSEIRKKAMTRLVLCAVALVASIIFSVLLLNGTFDGKTGGSQPASGDTRRARAHPRADAGAHARARVRGPERAAHHLL